MSVEATAPFNYQPTCLLHFVHWFLLAAGSIVLGRQSREDESMLLSAEDVTTARLQVLELGTGTVKWDQNEDVRDYIDLYLYYIIY